MKVLVVEDEPAVRELLRELLVQEGFEVVTAEEGQQGCDLAEKGDFDLVLMDLKMPGLTGVHAIQTLEMIRPDLPILVLSGHIDDESIQETASSCNVKAWIEKPYSLEALLDAIREIVRK